MSTRARVYSKSRARTMLHRLARSQVLKLNDLEAPLRRSIALHWGDMRNARRILGLVAPTPPRQHWSRARVIEEIVELSSSGQHLSCSALIQAGRKDLILAAQTYCGSWVRARDLAGVRFVRRRVPPGRAWNARRVISEIGARHRDKASLAKTKVPSSLVSASQRIFGSWRAGVESAGLDYDAVMLLRTYEDRELIVWLRDLASAHPDMTVDEFYRHGGHSLICRRRWGSAEDVARAAGLPDWPHRERYPAMPRAAVLRALRSRARSKEALNLSIVRETEGGHHLVNSVFRHFGTWDEAIEAANLPPQRLVRAAWTREEVIRELRRWRREPESLTPNQIKQRDVGFYGALFKLFGSYAAAMKAANVPSMSRQMASARTTRHASTKATGPKVPAVTGRRRRTGSA